MCFRRWWFPPLLVALVLGLGGCGGGPKLYTVTGTVTLDGKPLPGAAVLFLPTAEDGRQATGVTNADGSFQLETFKSRDGAQAGDYKVVVQYSESVPAGAVAAPKEGQSMKDMWEASQKAMKEQQNKPPKYVVPTKYSDPGQTVLKQRVPPEGPVKLDLQSK